MRNQSFSLVVLLCHLQTDCRLILGRCTNEHVPSCFLMFCKSSSTLAHVELLITAAATNCIRIAITSDKVHRLHVTLSYFRPDRFVQLLILIPILILLLYLLVSIDLVYIGLCEFFPGVYPEGKQLYSKFSLNCSGAETTSSFSTYKYVSILEMEYDWLIINVL